MVDVSCRFKGVMSPEQSYGYDQENQTKYGLYHTKIKPSLSSITDTVRTGFMQARERVEGLKSSPIFRRSNDKPTKRVVAKHKILDPQGPFLQKWNKIFVLISIIAVSLDPLFFYIPVIDSTQKCLDMDNNMKIIACVFRTLIDALYILHIVFEFRTGFIAPSSRVFGRGELNEDPHAIAKRYLKSYFFVDILSILPLPQVSL